MKFKQIEKKYPKAYSEFVDYYNNVNKYAHAQTLNYNVRTLWEEVTDFFDNKKIYICVTVNNHTKDLWTAKIDYINYSTIIHSEIFYKSRKEAESKGIENAFIIREQQINKSNK